MENAQGPQRARLFYLDWRNIQTGINSCGGIVVNGGTAASDGFDFSVRAAATDRVRLAAVVEYANARYKSTVHLADGTVVQSGTVVEGLGVAPPWTANFSAEADLYRTAQITVALLVEDAVHSRNTVIPFNTSHPAGPGGSQLPGSQYFLGALNADPAINLVNASMRFVWAGHEVNAFATNVLDSPPLLSRQPLIQGYPSHLRRNLAAAHRGVAIVASDKPQMEFPLSAPKRHSAFPVN